MKITKFLPWVAGIVLFFATMYGAAAVAPSFTLGSCYDPQTVASDDGAVFDLVIAENCSNYGQVDWTGSTLNLTTLGAIVPGEIIIGNGYAYVNSILRPDLNDQAVITLKNLTFAYQPTIYQDAVVCSAGNCTSITYTRSTGELTFTVSKFSNYSVTGRQDFDVYSDTEAYLHGRVYDSLDLGSSYLAESFKCVVMLFETEEKRLIQTNPEKKKAGRLFSGATSSEDQLPEILGYFKIENGLGNVYYRDDDIVGYTTFLKVIKCNSNSTELVYEEEITPVYRELFKAAPARGVQLIDSASNAVFVVILFVIVIGVLWYAFFRK